MTDFSLLKNAAFTFVFIANFFGILGYYIPFFFLPMRLSDSAKKFISPSCGIPNTLGRIAFGLVSDFKGVNTVLLHNVMLTLGAVCTLLMAFFYADIPLLIITGFFGFFISAYVILTTILLCEILGIDKLTNGFGLLILSRGVSTILGPPITAGIMTIFGADSGYFFAGGLLLLAASLHFVLHIPIIHKFFVCPKQISHICKTRKG